MISRMLPYFVPLLAAFGLGGKHKSSSRLGFVPENNVGIVIRFDKVVRYREAPPRYRVMRWRRSRPAKCCWSRALRWHGYRPERAGLPRTRHPGVNWSNIPFIDKTHHVSLMEKGIELKSQEMQLKDQTFFTITAAVRWVVADPYRVSFMLEQFENLLKQRCEASLMSVLSELDAPEMQRITDVNAKLLAEVTKWSKELGVRWIEFSIIRSQPTPYTLELLQMERRAKSIAAAASHLTGVDATAAMIVSGNTIIASPERTIGSSLTGGLQLTQNIVSLPPAAEA